MSVSTPYETYPLHPQSPVHILYKNQFPIYTKSFLSFLSYGIDIVSWYCISCYLGMGSFKAILHQIAYGPKTAPSLIQLP